MAVFKSTSRRKLLFTLLLGGLALAFAFTFALTPTQSVQALSLPAGAPQLVAQQSEVVIPVTLIELFKFIGTPVFVGFIVSFLLENVQAFQDLTRYAKAAAALVVVVLLSLLSYWLVNYVPTAFIQALEPWYAAAVTGVIGFIASQVWHKVFNQTPTIEVNAEQLTE